VVRLFGWLFGSVAIAVVVDVDVDVDVAVAVAVAKVVDQICYRQWTTKKIDVGRLFDFAGCIAWVCPRSLRNVLIFFAFLHLF
jgi:hypothetical protein